MTFREEIIGDARLILGDCREALPTLGFGETIVTDPPYGIDFQYESHDDSADGYPDLIAPLSLWPRAVLQYPEEMMRFMVPQWGAPDDCYAWIYESNLPRQFRLWGFWGVSPQWAALREPAKWAHLDKVKSETRASHDWCEMPQVKNWSGEKNEHPCQAPTRLLQNVIALLPAARTILDPFMGSGTTGVACMKLGRRFIGIEIEPKYFDIACRRVEEAWKQPRLFEEPRVKPVQETLQFTDD